MLPLPPALAERLASGRPLPFAEYVELALYDPADGFYATGGAAGRRADFLTSPEVGPLFGALVGRWLDDVWGALGEPDPFVVVEVGAGPGTLARTVRAGAPRCAPVLRYVLVERSAAQRAGHAEHLPGWVGDLDPVALAMALATPLGDAGPWSCSAAEAPAAVVGAVVANELLDNLPFDVVRHDGAGGAEQLAVVRAEEALEAVAVPAPAAVGEELAAAGVGPGRWAPWPAPARAWVGDALGRLRRGRLLVVDYGAPVAELAERPELGWLRTYRGNERGAHPLDAPGAQDITADVAVDLLQRDHPATRVRRQAALLQALGIEELVEQGRRHWAAHAAAPDVAALRMRSRVGEAEALTDPDGLGGFVALEWDVGLG